MARAACSSSQPMSKLCAARFQRSLGTPLLRAALEKTGDSASSRTFRPQQWLERCCVYMKNASREFDTSLREISRRAHLDETCSKKDEAPNGLLSVRRFRSFVNCLR